jgi:hypothetical protein
MRRVLVANRGTSGPACFDGGPESRAGPVIMGEVTEPDVSASERLRAFLVRIPTWYLEHIERVSVNFKLAAVPDW